MVDAIFFLSNNIMKLCIVFFSFLFTSVHCQNFIYFLSFLVHVPLSCWFIKKNKLKIDCEKERNKIYELDLFFFYNYCIKNVSKLP